MQKPSEGSQIPSSTWLDIEDFEYLCFDFAREYLSYDEPIPDYSTRNNALLESSLGSPKQTFSGKFLYPTLEKQAAILFYSLIKNGYQLNHMTYTNLPKMLLKLIRKKKIKF